MSYLGGEAVIHILDGHYGRKGSMVEVVSLKCKKCGWEHKIRIPHSTPDHKIVKIFRSEGRTCDDNGHNAICPRCNNYAGRNQ